MTAAPAASVASVLAGDVPTGTMVTVQGWVRTRRDSKAGLSFVSVSDGSCFDALQVVCPQDLTNYENEVVKLTAGCSVICRGELVESQGKGQTVELRAQAVEVVGWVDDPDTYPIAAKRHTFEYLREVAHLRPRSNTFGAVARVRHALAMAIHRYYGDRGFTWIHTPIITASDCEGAGEMFRVSTLDLLNMPRDAEGQVDFTEARIMQVGKSQVGITQVGLNHVGINHLGITQVGITQVGTTQIGIIQVGITHV